VQKLIKWFLLLNKRLYKKTAFVLILVVILASVCLFKFALGDNDGGFLNIVLVNENKSDKISTNIVKDLLSEDSLILFSQASSYSEAVKMVKSGSADSAWIFSENTTQNVEDFSKTKSAKNSIVTVVEREPNVFLRLSREKLTSKLFRYTARAGYLGYIRKNITQFEDLNDDELMTYFDNIEISDDLFIFDNPVKTENNSANSGYMTAPVRGFLGILVLLCSMASALYYMQDIKHHTFDLVPETKLTYVSFASIMIATLNVATVSFLALLFSGMSGAFLKELLILLGFAVASTAFSMLLIRIFSNINLFSAVIPIFVIIMIAVCPVFFEFKEVRFISLLFTPTYYVKALYDVWYLLYMLLYSIFCFALYFAIGKIKNAIKLKSYC